MDKTPDFLSRIIARAEIVLRTDLRYIFHGMSWSIVGQTAAVLSSLALSVVLSHAVSKEIYGTYKYVLSFVAILSVLSLNNVGGAVFQSVARGFDGALKEGFRVNLHWSIAIFAGAVAAGAYYFFAHNLTLAFAILIGGCISPFITSANIFGAYLGAKKDFARQTLYMDVWGNAIPVALLIATAYVSPRVVSLVAAYFIGNAAVALYFYFRTRRVYGVKKDAATDPHMIAYGKHISVIGVLAGIAGNVDKLLLFHYVAASELAVYAFATGILDQLKGPIKTLDTMMQARFATRTDADLQSGIPSKMLWMFLFSIITVLAFIAVAPVLYRLLFPAYLEAVPYARVYAFSLLGITFYPIASYIVAKSIESNRRLRDQYLLIVIPSIIQIAAIFVGILGWGLWGLVVARVASSFATGLVTILIYLTLIRGRTEI